MSRMSPPGDSSIDNLSTVAGDTVTDALDFLGGISVAPTMNTTYTAGSVINIVGGIPVEIRNQTGDPLVAMFGLRDSLGVTEYLKVNKSGIVVDSARPDKGDISVGTGVGNGLVTIPATTGGFVLTLDSSLPGGMGWKPVTGGSGGGIISVGSTGKDYTTIGAALAVAVSGETVQVYPGTYPENITIPDGVRVLGAAVSQSATITGSDTTGVRVTLVGNSTIKNMSVIGPSSGTGPTIDASGIASGKLAVAIETVILGGGAGKGVLGPPAGAQMFLQQVYHNGGAFSGAVVECNAGTTVFDNVIFNAGSAAQSILINGGSNRGEVVSWQSSALYAVTDGINISGGSLQLTCARMPEGADAPAVNGLHISGDGIDLDINGGHIGGLVDDLLIDPALTGVGSTLRLAGLDMKWETVEEPTLWSQNATFLGLILDVGNNDDSAIRALGELSVGTPENPSDFSAGEGDASTRAMVVFSFDGASTYVDNTAAAKSNTGSAFPILQSTAVGEICYIGNTARMFQHIRIDPVAAGDDGSGGGVWEYWNGAWTEFDIMATEANAEYLSRATDVWSETTDSQIYMDLSIGDDWVAADPGTGTVGYYVRYRVTGALTTVQTLQRVKCGTNHTEINSDGRPQYFGAAEAVRTFWSGNGESVSAPSGGANSPGNYDVDLSANVSYRQARSQFNGGGLESCGTQIIVPEGLDTSRELEFVLDWVSNGTSTAAMRWDFYVAEVPAGSILNSTTIEQPVVTKNISPTGTAEEVIQTRFAFRLNDLKPGESFGFSLYRNGSADSNGNNSAVLAMSIEGYFWR